MRIFSKYHDYYDTVRGFGFDPTCVYNRKEEEIYPSDTIFKEIINNSFIKRARSKLPCAYSNRKITNEQICVYDSFILLFCAKIYPCIIFSIQPKQTYEIKEPKFKYCYTFDDAIKYSDERRYSSTNKQNLDSLFSYTEHTSFINLHQKLQVPSIMIFRKDLIILNPILKNYKFYKVMDSFTTFQELSMFLGGIISQPEKSLIKISNDIRLQKHGFDLKKSFRKEK